MPFCYIYKPLFYTWSKFDFFKCTFQQQRCPPVGDAMGIFEVTFSADFIMHLALKFEISTWKQKSHFTLLCKKLQQYETALIGFVKTYLSINRSKNRQGSLFSVPRILAGTWTNTWITLRSNSKGDVINSLKVLKRWNYKTKKQELTTKLTMGRLKCPEQVPPAMYTAAFTPENYTPV